MRARSRLFRLIDKFSHPIKIRDNFFRLSDWMLSDPGCSPLSHAAFSALFVVMRTHLGIMNLFGHFHEKREPTPGLNYPRDSVMRNMRARNCRNNEKRVGWLGLRLKSGVSRVLWSGAGQTAGPGQVQTIIWLFELLSPHLPSFPLYKS